ncbi:MAG: prephenate dehydratase [Thermoguttaceae bacterium]|nr:prephenate dehydratase [Thermoguttaceae bacterium]MDW8077972.1 prephenate dehydratase [Thermoguttaceae bacterium]
MTSGSRPKTKNRSHAGNKARQTPSLAPAEELAQVDGEILQLLKRRAELALQLYQQDPRLFSGPESWKNQEVWLEGLLSRAEGPLPERTLRAILLELAAGCRQICKPVRVAYLGPAYSYSHLAAMHHFGQSAELVSVGTIAAVFEEVNRGQSDYGLVPLENSTDGRVADTLEMFARLPVRICGQVELVIHHALLARCKREEIREVYSRPQALSQCRNWLARHLPGVKTVEVTSTSAAAQLASEKPGAAAIASVQAGIHYQLNIIAECIEDNPNNTTRFAVIGMRSAPPTGNDLTAMMFQVEHRPGALADAMMVFKRNGLNLTWIESFPVPGTRGAYLFFVEMEGHETDPVVERAFAQLKKKTLRLEMLGSYPVTEPIG